VSDPGDDIFDLACMPAGSLVTLRFFVNSLLAIRTLGSGRNDGGRIAIRAAPAPKLNKSSGGV
jgi:hypothetical protein